LPGLRVHEDAAVNEGGDVGWLIRKGSPKLKQEIDEFARSHGQGSLVGNLLVRKYTGSTRFLTDASSPDATKRFKQVVDLFRKYGDRYSLDYLLVLAQGYQESRLNQSALSPVGAVGVMQVMPATGEELGVGDIHQLEPNIHAGVKYIRKLIDQNFASDSIDPLNQTLLAFAAYNAGAGRVRRLRTEAAKQGLNPNVWRNNVELIAARRIGAETVTYVANIYKYYVAYRLVQRQQEEREKEIERLRSRPQG
ncbi:MAG TPA: transglycosylase SLT domain-containing protein, partial [Gemmatimonadales bacterium]